MRVVAALALAATIACGSAPGGGYLNDVSSRRATLEASLVNRENGYSKLRLAHYATGQSGDWDSLPVWNPPAEPFLSGSDVRAPLGPDAAALSLELRDQASLLALGKLAFDRYPVQLASAAEDVFRAGTPLADYGLATDASGRVGGLLRVQTSTGPHLAYSCATCHRAAGVDGVANASFDLGKLIADAARGRDPRDSALLAWGPGRVDVTSTAATEPVRVPDLRPTRYLGYLHATASVRQRDVPTLAVRLETLVIVSNAEEIRPPREIALALATYLWSLADSLPPPAPTTDEQRHGADLFAASCASCHAPAGFTGAPVSMATVGTDPVALSTDRFTGNARVPSLRGVHDRGLLLHDASASSLEELFNPARLQSEYRGRLGKPIVGHDYGLALSATDGAALLAYLRLL